MPPPRVEFEVRRTGSEVPSDIPVSLTGWRLDLSGTEAERAIDMLRATLIPGYWEFSAKAAPGRYIESIAAVRTQARRRWRPSDPRESFDRFLEMSMAERVRITISENAALIVGTVSSNGKPVRGAPVFLWPLADLTRRSLGRGLQVLSNTQGRFQFDSLPAFD